MEKEMEQLFAVAAGLDVHRDTVVVSVRRLASEAGGRHKVDTRAFETFHDSLVEMARWLCEADANVVGLESTGDHWQPVVRALQQYAPSNRSPPNVRGKCKAGECFSVMPATKRLIGSKRLSPS
jgi:hypothetical protein